VTNSKRLIPLSPGAEGIWTHLHVQIHAKISTQVRDKKALNIGILFFTGQLSFPQNGFANKKAPIHLSLEEENVDALNQVLMEVNHC
jgi:hypothetical protein